MKFAVFFAGLAAASLAGAAVQAQSYGGGSYNSYPDRAGAPTGDAVDSDVYVYGREGRVDIRGNPIGPWTKETPGVVRYGSPTLPPDVDLAQFEPPLNQAPNDNSQPPPSNAPVTESPAY
jgi:hypothetical protein